MENKKESEGLMGRSGSSADQRNDGEKFTEELRREQHYSASLEQELQAIRRTNAELNALLDVALADINDLEQRPVHLGGDVQFDMRDRIAHVRWVGVANRRVIERYVELACHHLTDDTVAILHDYRGVTQYNYTVDQLGWVLAEFTRRGLVYPPKVGIVMGPTEQSKAAGRLAQSYRPETELFYSEDVALTALTLKTE